MPVVIIKTKQEIHIMEAGPAGQEEHKKRPVSRGLVEVEMRIYTEQSLRKKGGNDKTKKRKKKRRLEHRREWKQASGPS